ncbi:MAG: asparagine synthase (glutamine-hydrolyzing), partial [Elusimicrobiota bacterium]
MCGITGVLSLGGGGVPADAVERMASAIRHRGPNEQGRYRDAGLCMRAERLKVIDLKTGAQPIYSEDRDVVVVFNGEVYNYRELRAELEKKGHRFSTKSDTETIVHLYEEYGDALVDRLNGMFAFALYDRHQGRLLLARDRAGIKPLFYAVHGDRLFFASEMKAILCDPDFPREIDPEALNHYLSFSYVSAPRTMYRHIRRLPAGHRLIAEKGRVTVKRYWDMTFRPDRSRSLPEWEEEFRTALTDSMRRHLHSDVPVGVYLSGGLDSASIVSEAVRQNAKVSTFSVGCEESSTPELAEARLTAEHFGTDHHEYVFSHDRVAELMPEALSQFDEPMGDWSRLPNYFLSREAGKNATVVLVGTGGGELFGGDPAYLAAKAGGWYRRLPPLLRSKVIEPIVRGLPASFNRRSWNFIAKSFVEDAALPLEQAHHHRREIYSPEERGALLTNEAGGTTGRFDPFGSFAQHQDVYEKMEWMDRLFYLDFKVFMADCSLWVDDITTSAHSLEGRAPFLDQAFLDLSSRLPWRLKVKRLTTRHLLRRAMAERLPKRVLKMKKGFPIPGAAWLKGPLKPFVMDMVSSSEKELEWLFDFVHVRKMLKEHFDRRQDHTRRISC